MIEAILRLGRMICFIAALQGKAARDESFSPCD